MATLKTVYVCIKLFNAWLSDELSLKIGDKIEVLADDSEYNDGWFMGRQLASGAVGLFPKTFTKEFVQSDAPGLLRSRSRRVPTNSKVSNTFIANSTSNANTSDMHSTLDEINRVLEDFHVSDGGVDTSLGSSKRRPRSLLNSLMLMQDLNPLKCAEWTPKQVSSYFAIVLGLDMEVAGKFARHQITGQILLQLNLELLKELEIDSFGTRFEVNREIEKLRKIAGRRDSHRAAQQHCDEPSETTEAEGSSKASLPYTYSDEEAHTNASSTQSMGATRHASDVFLLPSAHFKAKDSANARFEHHRTKSHSLENLAFPSSPGKSPTLDNVMASTFMTPRKAPQPLAGSQMNTALRFGGLPATPGQYNAHSPYVSRTKASTTNLSRPTSALYDKAALTHSRALSSGKDGHKRHSSVFLFLSGNNDDFASNDKFARTKDPVMPKKSIDGHRQLYIMDGGGEVDIDEAALSPKKEPKFTKTDEKDSGGGRKLMGLRSVSTQNFRNLTGLKKLKTSAFTEGIRDINPDDAIKMSSYSGWMSKKSGGTLGWRLRYFTLHGTRLSYFTSLRDKREKGLIDITAHKVIPVSTESEVALNDKYVAMYASLAGFGRYCFKLVPPAPGFKKGLTFTQPKTHFFAVETQEEMRGWMKALMTATIDIDDSVPVVSSCNTPTVTLARAQELLAKAREETKMKDETLRVHPFGLDMSLLLDPDSATSDDSLMLVKDDELAAKPLKLRIETLGMLNAGPDSPRWAQTLGGFASPYLLASGLLSPKQTCLPVFGVSGSQSSTPLRMTRLDYFGAGEAASGDRNTSDEGPKSPSPRFAKKKSEKMMAYTSDGTFVINARKK
ncbi:hypothetical protein METBISCDRAFT_13698 [Metschnikowia bicuspidata]|uniref:PH-domain-containing protein n=1 Tax=Metschnikowia bicuspidata TaxID=27322 RepID=A0A4P9ZF26_9ASCO|nr:hypothetical protein METBISCDRAFT_13698 [Metschnikowia bicuspidata]